MSGKDVRCWVEVDLEAIKENTRAIRSALPSTAAVMAVVKADAYGHGIIPVSKAALEAGVEGLGVATVEEGRILREVTDRPIYVLIPFAADEADEVVQYGLIPLLSEIEVAEALSRAAADRGRVHPIHLEIDTGMSRAGRPVGEALSVIEKIGRLPGVRLEGLATHFAVSDDPADPFTDQQIDLFDELLATLEQKGIRPKVVHAANSGAIVNHPRACYQLVRPGIAIYGYYPSPLSQKGLKLVKALTWKARIVHLKDIPAGTAVSYGRTYVAGRPIRLATVSAGYGDGLTWSLSNKAEVLVRGRRASVVGRVCMDITAVDVSDVPEVKVGDEVIFTKSLLPSAREFRVYT
jgi:alanine racemase